MSLCYYANGMAMRAVPSDFVAQAGEVVFPPDALPTTQQLTDAFAGYAAAVAAAQAPQTFAAKLAAGITLASTGTPAIDGTYAYDPQTQTDLSGIAATIGLLGTFPDGTTSGYQYPQQGGQAVTTFASLAAFRAFYAPYAKLLQLLQTQGAILAAGGAPSWPSQSVTVA